MSLRMFIGTGGAELHLLHMVLALQPIVLEEGVTPHAVIEAVYVA